MKKSKIANSQEPLFIFVHLPKCGGTTINYHLRYRFKKEEFLYLSKNHGFYNLAKQNYEMLNDRKQIDDYLSSLSPSQRDKIKIISGHAVYYGIHRFFNKKPIYFTFLRDPFTRTASQYSQYRRGLSKKPAYDAFSDLQYSPNTKTIKKRIVKDGAVLEFKDWIKEKRYQKKAVTQYFIRAKFLRKKCKDSINRKDIENFLKKFYFIGILENFDEDFLLLSRILKLKKFFGDQNVSRNKPTKELDKDTLENIKKIFAKNNKEDFQLYLAAKEFNRQFKEKIPNLQNIIQEQKIKRARMVPFTNVMLFIERAFGLIKCKLNKIYDNKSQA
jgi:hypothetical protein